MLEAVSKSLELRFIVASESYLNEHLDLLNSLGLEEISVVEDKAFADLITTTTSCGVVSVAKMPSARFSDVEHWQPRVLVVADGIQDPGNLGTIIRTAYAAQVGGLIILKGSVDHFNPKVVRASVGALFDLPIIADIEAEQLMELLKQLKIRLLLCEASGSRAYFDANLSNNVAIVLGNEGQGVNPMLQDGADETISIPMNPKSESLNVAISGGIILFESLRQRLAVSSR